MLKFIWVSSCELQCVTYYKVVLLRWSTIMWKFITHFLHTFVSMKLLVMTADLTNCQNQSQSSSNFAACISFANAAILFTSLSERYYVYELTFSLFIFIHWLFCLLIHKILLYYLLFYPFIYLFIHSFIYFFIC